MSTEFSKHLEQSGIRHELSVPYTPQQNGGAERLNRTLLKSVRTMLKHMDCETKWWAEAVTMACYVKNPVTTVGLPPPRMRSGLALGQTYHICESLAQNAGMSPRRHRETNWMTGRVKDDAGLFRDPEGIQDLGRKLEQGGDFAGCHVSRRVGCIECHTGDEGGLGGCP
jgi:transposase InsO family protein